MAIKYKAIGIIRSPFSTIEGMPIQAKAAKGIKGTVEVNDKFTDALKDLDGFSHIFLIYHLHKSKGYTNQVTPFLDTHIRGLFATRAPRRPNPIGLSVVKLTGISGNILEIENVDVLDRTPLLDIKPYISAFDSFQTEKDGWVKFASENMDDVKSDKRFD